MAALTKETIRWLAQLSRIHCTPEEEESLLGDLQKIFNYFEQLNGLETEGVPPCHHVIAEAVNPMRDDIVEPSMSRERFLANATHTAGLIKVPPVIASSN